MTSAGAAAPVPRPRADRGMLIGSTVCALFGAAWAWWAAGGLTGSAAVVLRVVGSVIAVAVLVADAVRLRRATPPADGSASTGALRSRRYWWVNLVEFALIFVGAALLGRAGHATLIIVWTSAVVGAHFLVFGRWFWPGFVGLGAWLLVGAGVGAVVALVEQKLVIALTGSIAAAALLTFAVVMPFRSGGPGASPGVARGR